MSFYLPIFACSFLLVLSTLYESIAVLHAFIEIFVEWRSGHPDKALPVAMEAASRCNNDTFKFGYILYFHIFGVPSNLF